MKGGEGGCEDKALLDIEVGDKETKAEREGDVGDMGDVRVTGEGLKGMGDVEIRLRLDIEVEHASLVSGTFIYQPQRDPH